MELNIKMDSIERYHFLSLNNWYKNFNSYDKKDQNMVMGFIKESRAYLRKISPYLVNDTIFEDIVSVVKENRNVTVTMEDFQSLEQGGYTTRTRVHISGGNDRLSFSF